MGWDGMGLFVRVCMYVCKCAYRWNVLMGRFCIVSIL